MALELVHDRLALYGIESAALLLPEVVELLVGVTRVADRRLRIGEVRLVLCSDLIGGHRDGVERDVEVALDKIAEEGGGLDLGGLDGGPPPLPFVDEEEALRRI